MNLKSEKLLIYEQVRPRGGAGYPSVPGLQFLGHKKIILYGSSIDLLKNKDDSKK
jgi:hypothetical protein